MPSFLNDYENQLISMLESQLVEKQDSNHFFNQIMVSAHDDINLQQSIREWLKGAGTGMIKGIAFDVWQILGKGRIDSLEKEQLFLNSWTPMDTAMCNVGPMCNFEAPGLQEDFIIMLGAFDDIDNGINKHRFHKVASMHKHSERIEPMVEHFIDYGCEDRLLADMKATFAKDFLNDFSHESLIQDMIKAREVMQEMIEVNSISLG